MHTTFHFNKWLDLPTYVGQRVDRFIFEHVDGVTGQHLSWVKPTRDAAPPQLSHNTTSTVKRRLQIALGVADTSRINSVRDRILPIAVINNVEYPLGRFMFTDDTRAISTGGDRGSYVLLDEYFAVDQKIESSWSYNGGVVAALQAFITQVPFVRLMFEASSFNAVGSFPIGTQRSRVIESYALQGDFFSPWFDNDGTMRFIRTRDPADEVPDFDYDEYPRVIRESIASTTDLLNAANRFIVVGNSSSASEASVVGTYDIPPSAPHSIANRGFVIPDVISTQVSNDSQAFAMARSIGVRQTITERLTFDTAFDPRHDGYNIIRFLDSNWLELSWTAILAPGVPMRHVVRKAYS